MIGFLFTSVDGEKAHVFFLRVVSPPWKLEGQSEEGKEKEKRVSQFQHSSDLPCHCTTRCSVCRTLRAQVHANDRGMKEPWQE